MKHSLHICSFASALDDIPAKKRRDSAYVLAKLKESPQFSVFAATQWPALARTLDSLHDRGLLDYDNSPGFPWTKAIITPKGEAFLEQFHA